jgi:hypothetical protein
MARIVHAIIDDRLAVVPLDPADGSPASCPNRQSGQHLLAEAIDQALKDGYRRRSWVPLRQTLRIAPVAFLPGLVYLIGGMESIARIGIAILSELAELATPLAPLLVSVTARQNLMITLLLLIGLYALPVYFRGAYRTFIRHWQPPQSWRQVFTGLIIWALIGLLAGFVLVVAAPVLIALWTIGAMFAFGYCLWWSCQHRRSASLA